MSEIDPKTVLPTWRFVLDPAMAREAKLFFDFVDFWPPYGWTDEQVKKWVEKTIIGGMPQQWPLIHKSDQKCGGLVSKTLMLMTVNPRDLPNGYRYLFGKMFYDITGPRQVERSCKYIWDHKMQTRKAVICDDEDERPDPLLVSDRTFLGENFHPLDMEPADRGE